ncbi:hypothetical protein LU276_06495 [Moraxella haemolytica]|uniref:Nmad5 family putative nucleotide modification protein n=1 Tax=Moraxella haemolytica TaxID=2904119 RepID=UPI0025434335|nr:Nmad5 family putative nucleotide modification protein [Moraxella sp. ZY171148]WII94673.1 hypothetical protein LU276_06495 [Moraxella sp. ZY171148]
MTRITKYTRELMLDELIKNGKFAENIQAKEQALKQAGHEIYLKIFGKYLDDIKKLPELLFNRTRELRLDDIKSRNSRFMLRVELPDYHVCLAFGSVIGKNFHGLTEDDEIIKKYLAAKQAYDDEFSKMKQARTDAEAVLSGINTFKQLWKMWPESQSLLGKFENQDKPNYPLVPQNIVNINVAFGLPVENNL